MTVYSVQTTGYDTYYPNNHHMGVDSGGRIWVLYRSSATHHFEYSDDDGATWAAPTNGDVTVRSSYEFVGGVVVAGDDALYHCYSNASYYLNVRRGVFTPGSPGSIAWTDAGAGSTAACIYADLIVHPEGSNYRVHIVWRNNTDGYLDHTHILWDGSWGSYSTAYSLLPSSTDFPHLDWNHATNSSKVVKSGGNPDLYLCAPRPSPTMYFWKATWSSGPTWTWSTGVAHSTSTGSQYGGMCYPGGGYVYFAQRYSTDSTKFHLFARNVANDTWYDIGQTPAVGTTANWASLAYDGGGNLYLMAIDGGSDAIWIKWTKTGDGPPPTGTFDGSWTTWEAGTVGQHTQQVDRYSMDRRALQAIWYDSSTGVRYGVGPAFNQDPTAPTWTAPTDNVAADVAETLTLDWDFNDPDPSDTQSAYTVRRKIGAAAWYYWNGSTWDASETGSNKITSSNTYLTLAASWGSDGDDTHSYGVKTWDQDDAGPSDWSSDVRVVPSAQDNPTVTAITTIDSKTYLVEWTVTTQTKYQVKVFRDVGLTDVEYDSGIQVSGTKSHTTPFLEEGTRYVWVQTYNDEGLASDADTEDATVTWASPPAPTIVVESDTPTGAVELTIDNPAPGGGEAQANWNEIYRREGTDDTTAIRVASNVPNSGTFVDWTVASGVTYQYQPVAWNEDNETSTEGEWTA